MPLTSTSGFLSFLRYHMLLTLPPCSFPNRPDPLTSFPRIPRLERVPSAHAARLHAYEMSPGLVRSQVGHALRLALPRIPHHHVREHVALNPVPRLAALGEHGDGLLGRGGVDAIGFGGNGDGLIGWGRGGRGGFGFVEERRGFEPSNGSRGYVLCLPPPRRISIVSRFSFFSICNSTARVTFPKKKKKISASLTSTAR